MLILTPKFPSITAPPVGAPPRDQTHPSSRPKTIRARRRRLLAIPSVRRARSTVLVARGHLRVTGPQWACVRRGGGPRDIQLLRARADPVSDHSRSWPTMSGLLGQTRPLLLSLEKTRRTLEKTQRVDASVQNCWARCGARAPRLRTHDAPVVRPSFRHAHDAAPRPVHAPARAPSARRGRVSAHFESSPRRARVRTPSSRRGRLRPQSAPLRACNGRGRATSLYARRSRRGRRFPFVGFISED